MNKEFLNYFKCVCVWCLDGVGLGFLVLFVEVGFCVLFVVCLFGLVVCGYLVLGRLCCVLDCFLFMVDL